MDTTTPTSPSLSTAPRIIIVEGNISAGKSTLCTELADALGYKLYMEPMTENPFLTRYYKEPKKYALPMQLWLLKQRFVTYISAIRFALENADTTPGVILDRSVFSDVVFAQKNYEDGNFGEDGNAFYHSLRTQMLSHIPAPHVVLYLDASPETCWTRIHELRKRDCEDGIPLEYLSGLHKCYVEFLSGMESLGATVMSLPWNDFGSTADVASAVAALPRPADSWVADAKLHEFVESPEAVGAAMSLGYTVDGAEGSEVTIADPDALTASECRTTAAVRSAVEDTEPSQPKSAFTALREALLLV